MKRNGRSLLLALFFVFFIAYPALSAESPNVDLTILHVNDTHGHLLPFVDKLVRNDPPVGGMAYLATMIERERADNPEGTLLLSAGDMFQGTPISNIFRGKPVIEIMNQLRFDAMAIGNHEFDWGVPVLVEMKANAQFPFLSSNIVDEKTGKGPDYATPFIFLTRKGLKIAVIGLSTPETRYTTKPTNVQGLVFAEPAKVLPGLITDVKGRGADLVVVLSHLGLDEDEALARAVPGIDVIVGGHSHTVVPKPIRVGDTLIVQAGYYGVYLGALRLKVDPALKKWVDYDQGDELTVVSSGPVDVADSRAAGVVAAYDERSREQFSKIVGATSVDLMRDLRAESNVGNLVTDAMRADGQASIAFMNSGGLRADIPKGDLDLKAVYTLLPFDNVVVWMDLTGEQVLQLLEESAATSRGILQVSGIRYQVRRNAPEGRRVKAVMADGSPIEKTKIYRIATNDFLAVGGDNYTAFQEGKNVGYGDSLRDCLADYLAKHSPVSPKVEGRVTIE